MNDYKDLVRCLKLTVENPIAGEAINAIEALAKERDAAVEDLREAAWNDDSLCDYCEHRELLCLGICYKCECCDKKEICACHKCIQSNDCMGWEWRGVVQ